MNVTEIVNEIQLGLTTLGIELGSTNIKLVLINSKCEPIATGKFSWQSDFIDGIWTLSLEKVWSGIKESYQRMSNEILNKYQIELKRIGAIGISGMMHGYLVFGKMESS